MAMTKAAKYTFVLLTLWVYIFGSSGFIVHSCFSSKSLFVSNSILSAWSKFMFENCENQNIPQESSQQNECSDDVLSIVPAKGSCSDFVYTLTGFEYQNQSNTDIPAADLVAVPVHLADNSHLLAENTHYQHLNTSHSVRGLLRCSIDKFCILLI